jgi:uncharacterized protein
MKLLSDVNLVLALVAERHATHSTARAWWDQLPATETIHICRPVQTGLLRLLSNEAVMGTDALSLAAAWSVYATLIGSGRFAFTLEPPGLDAEWERLCRPFGRSPKVVMDAYLAAFALAGSYRLVTLDRAFGQFAGLESVIL